MSFNGSGTFLINTAGQPVVAGTVISSTAFNALTADLATGLSTVITKDGQTTVTANIPMSTYKFTGLGVGSAATDSANLSQVQSTVTKLLTSVSGTDTITAVGAPVVAAYAAGQMFYFVATGDNTGAVTLNIDSLGAKAVTRDGSVALAAGDIKSGEVVVVVYDGTRFQVVSQLNSAGDARFANVSIASSLYVGGVSTFVGNAGFSANVSIASALSVGGVAAITGATTIGGNLTLNGGTANGVLFLNGSKVATSGTALVFDGTNLGIGATSPVAIGGYTIATINNASSGSGLYLQQAGATKGRVITTANELTVDTTAAIPLVFGTNNTERARIDSSGNLGIGTTSPTVALDVFRTAYPEVRTRSASYTNTFGIDTVGGFGVLGSVTNNAFSFVTNNTERARITSGGDLLVGTTSTSASSGEGFKVFANIGISGHFDPAVVTAANNASYSCWDIYSTATSSYRFYVTTTGVINAVNTTISAISDQRYKENICDLDVGLDAVLALKPRKFDWKTGKGKDIKNDRGFIAQEFEQVFPDLVDEWKDPAPEGEEPYKSVRQDLIPVLVKAIQELTARVAQLETK